MTKSRIIASLCSFILAGVFLWGSKQGLGPPTSLDYLPPLACKAIGAILMMSGIVVLATSKKRK